MPPWPKTCAPSRCGSDPQCATSTDRARLAPLSRTTRPPWSTGALPPPYHPNRNDSKLKAPTHAVAVPKPFFQIARLPPRVQIGTSAVRHNHRQARSIKSQSRAPHPLFIPLVAVLVAPSSPHNVKREEKEWEGKEKRGKRGRKPPPPLEIPEMGKKPASSSSSRDCTA